MKKRSKLKLNRETIATLDARQLRVGGGDDCTCSCCPSDCCVPTQPQTCNTCEYTCLNTCGCTTQNNEWSCICA
jgi:natural product precursor